MENIRYFGIRHHGPGSAKMLKKELEEFSPQIILMEFPADVQHLLDVFHPDSLRPPVSILQYNPKQFDKAYFLPLAEFSPEWIALNYSKDAEVPIVAIDLPAELTMSLADQAFKRKMMSKDTLDPMAYFAGKMGYADVEAWWEFFFELEDREAGHFETIEFLMEELRATFSDTESHETLLREAYMRKQIFAHSQEYQKIAVVAGAWHIPVIRIDNDYRVKADNSLLKGLKKTVLEHCWVPWSYERLKKEGGYSAGVENPAWYEWIYRERVSASSKWIVRVAEFLRKKNLPVSVSSAIDAHRLANTLAAMRGLSLPGLKELLESVEAGFGVEQMHLRDMLKMDFLTGTKIGFVNEKLNTIPIQKDFAARVKSARLSKDLESGFKGIKTFDLRKPANLVASNLLHTLILLDIPWGQWLDGESAGLGNFKENWELDWVPEYNLGILKAGLYGNTIDDAAIAWVRNKIERNDFSILGNGIDHVLKCGIPGMFSMVLDLLAKKIVEEEEMENWYLIFPKLVRFLKNGNIRKIEEEQLSEMLEKLYIKICIHLDNYVSGTDEEGARLRMGALNQCDRAVRLWLDEERALPWTSAMLRNVDRSNCLTLLRGALVRMVFYRGELELDSLLALAHKELTDRLDIDNAVNWLEGFLAGNPSGIIIQEELFGVVNDWIGDLRQEEFRLVLPVLRKIFAPMPPQDKGKILEYTIVREEEEAGEKTTDLRLEDMVEENLGRILE